MTEPATTTKDTRISSVLSRNPLLADFCRQYMEIFDTVSAYNKEVLAEKTSEWNTSKVLEKARQFASPENAEETKPEIKEAWNSWESAVQAMNLAKRNVLELTAKELGITLSSSGERDPEVEGPLKEKRKLAFEIGMQLKSMLGIIQDDKLKGAISDFLENNPLPAVGRDQARSFGNEGPATPKFRVHVSVFDADGNEKVSADGFSKAALELPKFYPKGEAIKADKLRAAWMAAGNTTENTVTNPVEFSDNDLRFVITKK